MATRKPLVVLNNNLLGELPNGDDIGLLEPGDNISLLTNDAGFTVGADWSVNLSNIPANITSWAAISPAAKADVDQPTLNGSVNVVGAVNASRNVIFYAADGVTECGRIEGRAPTIIVASTEGNDVRLRPDGIGSNTGELVCTTTTLTRGGNTVWDSGNFDPASKADDSAVVKTSGTQTGLAGNKTWTGVHTYTNGATPITLSRSGSSINTNIQYTNDGTTLYAGLAAAGMWAIGISAALSSSGNRWFHVTDANAFVANQAVWHAGNLAAGASVLITSGVLQRAALTGDVTASAGNNATTIANGAVTLAKMANMATASLLGRNTAGTGAPEVLNATTARGVLGLGTAALQDTGTSGANVPLLNGANTWSQRQVITGGIQVPNFVATGGDVSGHIQLHTSAGGYGVNVTSGQTNLVAAGTVRVSATTTGGLVTGTLGVSETISDAVGDVRDVPLRTSNGNFTLALTERGRMVISTNNTNYAWTVPPNSSVAFPTGSTVTFVHDGTSGTKTVTQGSGVTIIRGTTTGNIALTAGQHVTLTKVGTDRWRAF